MSMSGIEIDGDIPTLFNDMKLKSTHKYALFKIEGKKKIVLDECGDPKSTGSREEDKACFVEMMAKLTNEPRYILYDFDFPMKKDGRTLKKLGFIFWCDDNNAKIGDKMIYASTKDTIKKAFTGLGLEFQANDKGDLDYDSFADEVERKA